MRTFFLASIALTAGLAHADPADDALAEGRRLYDLREFSEAIVKFKEAYRLRTDAASLFNIAQSYRLLGDCANAYTYYKTFQRNYPTERPEVVAKFVAELEPCKNDKPVAPEPEPPAAEPVAKPLPALPPPRDELSGRGKQKFGIACGVAGVVLVGVGTYFGISARSALSDRDGSAVWNPDLDERAEKHAILSTTFIGTGAVALVGGAVLYYLGHRERVNGPRISATANSVDVGWSVRF